MSAAPKLARWSPKDRMTDRWVASVEAVLKWLEGQSRSLRLVVTYNSDRAPIRYPVPAGTPEPTEVRVMRAVRKESGDRDLRASGYGVEWYWRGRELEVSIIDGLGSVVEYDLVLELVA